MADSNFGLGTITFTAATQGQADTKRDNALVDWCKLHNLPIYQPDGTTPDASKVTVQTRLKVAAILREQLKAYRADQAAAAARDAQQSAPDDF